MSPEPPGLRAQASPAKGKGGSGDESAPSLVSRFGQNASFASLGSSQAAQAHYWWVRASEVIWWEYTRIIRVLSDAK